MRFDKEKIDWKVRLANGEHSVYMMQTRND